MFKLLLIGIMLSVFQQVTGINVMMYYAPDVFKSTGMGNDSAIYYTMIMGMVNLIFVTVSILFVDKVGRRKLMIFGPAGMGFFMFCISVAYFTGNFTGMLPLLLMMGYLAFFALSLGPIVWVLLGEIFPNRIRSRAVSVSILAMWAANFLVSFTFPILKESGQRVYLPDLRRDVRGLRGLRMPLHRRDQGQDARTDRKGVSRIKKRRLCFTVICWDYTKRRFRPNGRGNAGCRQRASWDSTTWRFRSTRPTGAWRACGGAGLSARRCGS